MSERVAIIPTQCPLFHAACVTVGIPLESHTPGISNVYTSADQWRDKGQGEVTFFLSQSSGLNPLAIAEIWLSPDVAIADALAVPQMLIGARTMDELHDAGRMVAEMTIRGAVAHMALFCTGKYKLPSLDLTDEEKRAVETLDEIPRMIEGARSTGKIGGTAAAKISEVWRPAMVAWVKAWVYNYRELRETWRAARPALKIERENQLPIIIPKGPQFGKLLRRWT